MRNLGVIRGLKKAEYPEVRLLNRCFLSQFLQHLSLRLQLPWMPKQSHLSLRPLLSNSCQWICCADTPGSGKGGGQPVFHCASE